MGAFCKVVFLAIVAIVLFCLGITEIVMGSVYLNSCPIQRYIPIYLVVSGCVGIILSLNSGAGAYKMHKKSQENSSGEEGGGDSDRLLGGMVEMNEQSIGSNCWSSIRGLVNLFDFIWMILGMYWVLAVRGKVDPNPGDPMFCNPQLYLFATVMVFIRLALNIVMLAFAVFCCGMICVAICMA